MPDTLKRLAVILTREYKLAPERLRPESLLEDLGIDSLGTVELLWNIEEEFGIHLPPEPEDLSTLDDVVRFVDALVARQGEAAAAAGTLVAAARPAP